MDSQYKRTIMFLGANAVQTPVIRLAKKLGYRVITCDYLPENPGHKYGDKYINISTVDMEAVLKVAQQEKINGIVSFASDVSAPTAAFVAEKMGLPGHPLKSVEILTHKDLFRDFLQKNGFPCPLSRGYDNFQDASKDWNDFRKPVVVKPTDSSGSKGVIKVDTIENLKSAVEYALSFSRSGRVVMEEFVEKRGAQIIGDVFSVNGKLSFSCYGDHIFDSKTGGEFAVQGGMFPLIGGKTLKERVDEQVQRVLSLLDMKTGAYNIEAREGLDGQIYLMEIGPRNGGNLIPELIHYATGIDMNLYTIKGAMGENCSELKQSYPKEYFSYYVVHSNKAGIFNGITIDNVFREKYLTLEMEQVAYGEQISSFQNASAAIGVVICHFSSRDEMESVMSKISSFVQVQLK